MEISKSKTLSPIAEARQNFGIASIVAGIGGAAYTAGELARHHQAVVEMGRQCADVLQGISYFPLLGGGALAIGYGVKTAVLGCKTLRR